MLITANLGMYSIATETNYQSYDEQIIDIEMPMHMPRPMLVAIAIAIATAML